MNCVRCGYPLENGARFCRNCGLPVANTPVQQPQQFQQYQQPQQFQQPQQYQQNQQPQQRKRRGIGCLGTSLATLLILAIVLVVAWLFVLRPYIHDQAVSRIDSAMTNAVNQVPVVGLPITPSIPLTITEGMFNTLISSSVSSSDIVQNPVVHITSQHVLLDFTILGQDCTVSAVPQMQNGKLVATDTQISGIVGLVISSDDVTAQLDSHIDSLQTHIGKTITNVQLENQEIILTVS